MDASSVSKVEPAASREPIAFIDLKSQQARIRPQLDRAIARVLAHGMYIMGPEISELEQQLKAFCGAKHVLTCSSGTDALVMVLMAKGIGPGDAVICPAFTFTATPEVIALLGATPIFCDVNGTTYNIDPASLPVALAVAHEKCLKPRGIIAVDLFGLPADYDAILPFAKENDLFVLVDAAQSFGGSRGKSKVGQFGLATATSFFPAKPLGCYGDGGAVVTDNDDLAVVISSIRQHGKGDAKYNIVRVGINGRLDTLQAAILLEKLKIFPDEIARRDAVARRYNTALSDVAPVPSLPAGCSPVWAQYTLRIKNGRRDEIANSLCERGIPTAVYYPRPLHRQPAYASYPVVAGGAPVAERLAREVLSLPMHPYLSETAQDRIIASVRELLSTA